MNPLILLQYKKQIAIGLLVIAYTIFIWNLGKNSEKIEHLKTQQNYAKEVIKLQDEKFVQIDQTLRIYNEASRRYQEDLAEAKPIIKEIRTQTLKEVKVPVYSECLMSQEYFESFNKNIENLNKGKK